MRNAIGTINPEGIFEEYGTEAIAAVTNMIVSQQNIALGLTELVLEHCIEDQISKEELFGLYEEALDFIKQQNENLM